MNAPEQVAVPAVAASVFGDSLPSVKRYIDILASRGVAYGLLGPREVGRLWDRHIFNSYALSGAISDGARMADVGSGAGLPGIPLALGRPDVSVILVESMLRRSRFLAEVVNELDLAERVTVRRSRAEEIPDTFDVVTARAVAPLDQLVRWCGPLLAPGGQLLALKGERAEEEFAKADAVIRSAGLSGEIVSLRCSPDVPPAKAVRLIRDR